MKRTLTTLCHCMFLSSTVLAGDQIGDRMLEDISLPRGNLLSWIARLNATVAPDHPPAILFVPALPSLVVAPCMTNDQTVVKWIEGVRTELEQSLCAADPSWSVLGVRDGIQMKFVKIKDILNLFQAAYGCRIVRTHEQVLVYPFPERLEMLCYSNRKESKRAHLGLIVGLYSGYRRDHVFIHENAAACKVYVLAPKPIHEKIRAEVQSTMDEDINVEGVQGDNRAEGQ